MQFEGVLKRNLSSIQRVKDRKKSRTSEIFENLINRVGVKYGFRFRVKLGL